MNRVAKGPSLLAAFGVSALLAISLASPRTAPALDNTVTSPATNSTAQSAPDRSGSHADEHVTNSRLVKSTGRDARNGVSGKPAIPRDNRHADRSHKPVDPPRPGTIEEDELGESGADTGSTDYMLYRGGWTQTSPRIYIVYWGNWTNGDPSGVMNRLWYFLSGVGGSSWAQTLTYYGYNCTTGTFSCPVSAKMVQNPASQLKDYWLDKSAITVPTTQAAIAAEAARAAVHFNDFSVDAQFVIATPTGFADPLFAKAKAGQVGGGCAWHYYTTANSNYISYTYFPYVLDAGTYCGKNRVNAGAAGVLDGVSLIAGHEYAESVVSPFMNGWNDSTGSAGEIGDKCNWSASGYTTTTTLSTGSFPVQPLWSNYSRYYTNSGCAFWSK